MFKLLNSLIKFNNDKGFASKVKLLWFRGRWLNDKLAVSQAAQHSVTE